MNISHLPIQAEIWWVDFGAGAPGEPAGARPALILAPTIEDIEHMPTVAVIPFTRRERTYRYRLPIEPTEENGLATRTFAQIDLIRTVARQRLEGSIGYLEHEPWDEIRALVSEFLDL